MPFLLYWLAVAETVRDRLFHQPAGPVPLKLLVITAEHIERQGGSRLSVPRSRPMPDALLKVENLTVQYCPEGAPEIANVSFAIARGEVVGLAGESGCGKTTLALSLLRLLPPSARIMTGSIRFRGQELMTMSERPLEAIRGAGISMVLQEPGIALHPMLAVGEQIADVVQAHKPWSRQRCREEATRMLLRVHLENVGRTYSAYPHQLSGGQQQRVVIAQALASQPDLVILDEPTASLDSRTQAEILTLLRELRER